MKMLRSSAVLVAAFSALMLAAAPAQANHVWGDSDGDGVGYHWASGNRSPGVVNKVSSSRTKFVVPAAVDEWAALGTPIQPQNASTGPIEVVAKNGSARWYGLAQISVSGGHITKGKVTLNTLYYNSLTASEWDHVLCQELGHLFGLDHNRGSNTTCMNDTILTAPQPNAHDKEQLNTIYAHADGGSSSSSAGGRPGNGQWITVHVFWAD